MNRQTADPKVTIQEISEDPEDGSAIEFILVIEDDKADGSSQLTEELKKIEEHLEDDVRLDQEFDDLQDGLSRLSQVLADNDSITSQRNVDLWPKMLAKKSNFQLHCCAICAQLFQDLTALQAHASNQLHSSSRLRKFYLFDCKLCTTSPPFSKPTLILDHIRSSHNEVTDENGVGSKFDKISVIQMHSPNPVALVKRIKILGNGVLLPPFQSSGQKKLEKPATSVPLTSLKGTSVPETSVPTNLSDLDEAERLSKSIASLGHTKIMSNIKKLIKNASAPTPPPSNGSKITVADFARIRVPSSQEFNDTSKKDISPKRKWAISGGRTVSQSEETNNSRSIVNDVPKLKKSKASISDELIDHSVELFSEYYEPHDEVIVVEDEPSAKKIRRESLQENVLSKERKSVESKQHQEEETAVTIKIEPEKGFLKLSSLLPDRSNAVHSVTLNGGMKKQCENLKKSEVEKIGLEGGMASTENPPSGVITSSTKFDSDSDQTLLPQKKFLYSESNSVVAV